jgi:hypothetical protein
MEERLELLFIIKKTKKEGNDTTNTASTLLASCGKGLVLPG